VAKVRVFISYDFDHDNDLKLRLIDQAAKDGSLFTVSDWSIREVANDWREKARKRISHVDLVLVICGEYTDTATSVNNEITLAQEVGRPYFLLDGRNVRSKKPKSALADDIIRDWRLGVRLETTAAARGGTVR
jgi:MTH538 TIR-like domain (DUF1863)